MKSDFVSLEVKYFDLEVCGDRRLIVVVEAVAHETIDDRSFTDRGVTNHYDLKHKIIIIMEQVSAQVSDFPLIKSSPRVSEWNQDSFVMGLGSPKEIDFVVPLSISQE